MRTSLILFASVVLLAACADESETTAPARAAVVSGTPAPKLDFAPGPGVAARGQRPDSVIVVFSPSVTVNGSSITGNTAIATCPEGTLRISGGFRIESGTSDFMLLSSEPMIPNKWSVGGVSVGSGAQWAAMAICLPQ